MAYKTGLIGKLKIFHKYSICFSFKQERRKRNTKKGWRSWRVFIDKIWDEWEKLLKLNLKNRHKYLKSRNRRDRKEYQSKLNFIAVFKYQKISILYRVLIWSFKRNLFLWNAPNCWKNHFLPWSLKFEVNVSILHSLSELKFSALQTN